MKYKFPKTQKLEYKLRDADLALHHAVATKQSPKVVDELREKYLTLYHEKTRRDGLYCRRDLPSQ